MQEGRLCFIMEKEACIHVPMHVYMCTHVYEKTPVIKTSKGALGVQLKALGIPHHGQAQGGIDTGGEPQGITRAAVVERT